MRTFRRGEKYQKPPGAANFCIREWRPRTPVSYYLERALEGRRANFASRGRRPTSIGAWLLDTGYRLSKGRSGNSQGAMVALGPDGLGGASSVIRCAEATCLEEGGLVTGPAHMPWTGTHGWPCNEKGSLFEGAVTVRRRREYIAAFTLLLFIPPRARSAPRFRNLAYAT